MSLILATGSNIGDKLNFLKTAELELKKKFQLIAKSRVYSSEPVDYFDQDDFYNQVLEFKLPKLSPLKCLELIQNIEKEMKRKKTIDKGPRNIDIDIIFFGLERFSSPQLIIPHPSWNLRSFVVRPLKELPFYDIIKKKFDVSNQFEFNSHPL